MAKARSFKEGGVGASGRENDEKKSGHRQWPRGTDTQCGLLKIDSGKVEWINKHN